MAAPLKRWSCTWPDNLGRILAVYNNNKEFVEHYIFILQYPKLFSFMTLKFPITDSSVSCEIVCMTQQNLARTRNKGG